MRGSAAKGADAGSGCATDGGILLETKEPIKDRRASLSLLHGKCGCKKGCSAWCGRRKRGARCSEKCHCQKKSLERANINSSAASSHPASISHVTPSPAAFQPQGDAEISDKADAESEDDDFEHDAAWRAREALPSVTAVDCELPSLSPLDAGDEESALADNSMSQLFEPLFPADNEEEERFLPL